MPIPAPRPNLLGALTPALALLLGLPAHEAQALGLGRPQIHSALGKPLDVSFPLMLAEGEGLTDGCLRAEVSAGDARVPAGLLQLRVEGEPGQWRVRLQSQARIEEPALRITLALGCPQKLTREFNAFIDPPAAPVAAAAALPPPPPVAPVAPPPALPASVAPAAEPAPRIALADPAPPPKPRPKPRPKPSGPRLTLERPEVLVAAAARPPSPTASAAEAEMTPELEAQITQLEQTVAQLKAELLARQQAEAAAAPASAASAAVAAAAASEGVAPPIPASAPPPEAFAASPAVAPARVSPYRDPMTWVLTLALSLVAGAAAFFVTRWRDERIRRERAYWRALRAAEGASAQAASPASPAPASPEPAAVTGMAPPVLSPAAALPDPGLHDATRPQPRPMPWPPAALTPPVRSAAPEPASETTPDVSMLATQPLPPRTGTPAPEVSRVPLADELLDLQQQVDFLQQLGQHESAAELIATRMGRSGSGAMPLLLLMELCQQRGEPEAFAELAQQFERRFGTLAPPWTQSLSRGRSLDACPSVIAHLQVVWADATAAMAMVQDLLAQGGGPGVPHFDLPAYRDLLTLYAVARDLFETSQRGEDVDLMLPMDSSFGSQ